MQCSAEPTTSTLCDNDLNYYCSDTLDTNINIIHQVALLCVREAPCAYIVSRGQAHILESMLGIAALQVWSCWKMRWAQTTAPDPQAPFKGHAGAARDCTDRLLPTRPFAGIFVQDVSRKVTS